MEKEEPLVDKIYRLERFPGKGGWTYAAIQEIKPDKQAYFGMVTVRGFIDDYALDHCKLMPTGKGVLFLPVKAAIRKKIKKEAGDQVRLVLYPDQSPLGIPNELAECFQNEAPLALENFKKLPEGAQKAWLEWIYSAKKEDTKAERIAKMMEQLLA